MRTGKSSHYSRTSNLRGGIVVTSIYQPPHQPRLPATSPTSLTSHLTNHLTNLLTNLTYQPPHQPPVPAGDKPGAAPTPSVLQNALYISRLKYLALYASSICLQPGLFTSSQF